MKLFDIKFALGTIAMLTGFTGALLGVLSLFPPKNNLLLGTSLLIIGIILVKIGLAVAKNQPPRRDKIEKDIMRAAKKRK